MASEAPFDVAATFERSNARIRRKNMILFAPEVPMAGSLDRRPRFTRHAVGVVDAGEELARTLDALEGLGHEAGSVSLTAAHEQVDRIRSGQATDERFASPRRASCSRGGDSRQVEGTGFVMTGPLSDHLAGLAGARDLPIEGLLAAWLPKRNADFLAEQLRAGRVLLWVHVADAEEERQACGVLLDYSHQRVQVHDLPLND